MREVLAVYGAKSGTTGAKEEGVANSSRDY